MYGTYGAFKHRVPGMFKIRYVGQSTVQTGLVRAAACSALPINTHIYMRACRHTLLQRHQRQCMPCAATLRAGIWRVSSRRLLFAVWSLS